MTGAAEMRRVIAHATDGIAETLEAERGRDSIKSPRTALMGTVVNLAYARGVLDLLGTYLTDTEPERPAGVAADFTLHLLDREGDTWSPNSDADTWFSESVGGSQTRAEIESLYGPVREAWIR